jgi:hypothetical protein
MTCEHSPACSPITLGDLNAVKINMKSSQCKCQTNLNEFCLKKTSKVFRESKLVRSSQEYCCQKYSMRSKAISSSRKQSEDIDSIHRTLVAARGRQRPVRRNSLTATSYYELHVFFISGGRVCRYSRYRITQFVVVDVKSC